MRFTCIILALVVIASSQKLEPLSNAINTIGETDGVLKCIASKDPMLKINNITSFCGSGFYAEKSDCYSAYSSFKLCLINNNCQS